MQQLKASFRQRGYADGIPSIPWSVKLNRRTPAIPLSWSSSPAPGDGLPVRTIGHKVAGCTQTVRTRCSTNGGAYTNQKHIFLYTISWVSGTMPPEHHTMSESRKSRQ